MKKERAGTGGSGDLARRRARNRERVARLHAGELENAAKMAGLEQAVAAFSLLLESDCDNVEALESRALALFTLGEYARAAADYRHLGELDPGKKTYPTAECHSFIKHERYEDALAAAERAVAIAPEDAALYCVRAICASHLEGDDIVERVRADMTRACELDPTTLRYPTMAYRFLTQNERFEAAIPFLDRMCEIEPKNPKHLFERATCKNELSDEKAWREPPEEMTEEEERAVAESARADLEAAIALGLEDNDVHFELVKAAEGTRDNAARLRALDRALAFDPDQKALLIFRADQLRAEGHVERAAIDHARAVELGYKP